MSDEKGGHHSDQNGVNLRELRIEFLVGILFSTAGIFLVTASNLFLLLGGSCSFLAYLLKYIFHCQWKGVQFEQTLHKRRYPNDL